MSEPSIEQALRKQFESWAVLEGGISAYSVSRDSAGYYQGFGVANLFGAFCAGAALAASSAAKPQQAVEVPPGFWLAPDLPSTEMLQAAVKSREGPAVYRVMSSGGLGTLESEAIDDYAAMRSAHLAGQQEKKP